MKLNKIHLTLLSGNAEQDGINLAQLLLDKGYAATDTYRRTSSINFWRIDELVMENFSKLYSVEYNLKNPSSIALVHKLQSNNIYNLASHSFLGRSFDQPNTTAQKTGIVRLNLLEGIRLVNPKTRFDQPSGPEMLSKMQVFPQIESVPFYPRSFFGLAKLKLGQPGCLKSGSLGAKRNGGFPKKYLEAMSHAVGRLESNTALCLLPTKRRLCLTACTR